MRYVVRCEDAFVDVNTIEEALSEKEFLSDLYDYVEIYDTQEDKFL
jgi:hypothetical protein